MGRAVLQRATTGDGWGRGCAGWVEREKVTGKKALWRRITWRKRQNDSAPTTRWPTSSRRRSMHSLRRPSPRLTRPSDKLARWTTSATRTSKQSTSLLARAMAAHRWRPRALRRLLRHATGSTFPVMPMVTAVLAHARCTRAPWPRGVTAALAGRTQWLLRQNRMHRESPSILSQLGTAGPAVRDHRARRRQSLVRPSGPRRQPRRSYRQVDRARHRSAPATATAACANSSASAAHCRPLGSAPVAAAARHLRLPGQLQRGIDTGRRHATSWTGHRYPCAQRLSRRPAVAARQRPELRMGRRSPPRRRRARRAAGLAAGPTGTAARADARACAA